jgi:hypothetical protein
LSVHYIEADEMHRLADEQGLEVLGGGAEKARPNVYFRNLYRFRSCFIAGTLARGDDSRSDCVAGATVRLFKDGKTLAKVVSDAFGDFKFDGLTPRSGSYRIDIEYQAASRKSLDVVLEKSRFLGTIWI